MYRIALGTMVIGVFLFPCVSFAAVVINEIAWMGTHVSANHEWIELHNTGTAAVSLEGWRLSAIDGSPSITLAGSIAPGGYFLLERTSDETVPGVTADQIYTGVMGNAGEVFELFDAAGARVDRVDGSDGWSIGGNNTTKDTAQRMGNGWVTGRPTPKAANTSEFTPVPEVERTGTTTASTVTTATATIAVATPNPKRPILYGREVPPRVRVPRIIDPLFSVAVAGQESAFVGVPAVFTATAHSGERELVADEIFTWNFGDGTTARGRTVRHRYEYPGVYLVTVEGTLSLFKEPKRAHETMMVTVEAPGVTIAAITGQYVEIANTRPTTLDLSGMVLAIGTDTVRFPAHTYIPGEGSVRFSRSALSLTNAAHPIVHVVDHDGYVLARSDASMNAVVSETVLAKNENNSETVAPPRIASLVTPSGAANTKNTASNASVVPSPRGLPVVHEPVDYNSKPAPALARSQETPSPIGTARLTGTTTAAMVAGSHELPGPVPLVWWLVAVASLGAAAGVVLVRLRALEQVHGILEPLVQKQVSADELPPAEAFVIIEDDETNGDDHDVPR